MAVPKLGCVARYFLNFHRSGDVRAITLAFSARAATAAIVPPRRRRSFLRLLFSPRWSSGSFSASRVVNHPREAHTFGEITRPALGANRTIKFAALQSAIDLARWRRGGTRGTRGTRGGGFVLPTRPDDDDSRSSFIFSPSARDFFLGMRFGTLFVEFFATEKKYLKAEG